MILVRTQTLVLALSMALSMAPLLAAQPAAVVAPSVITVDYPLAETIFPPDFMSPTFQWRGAATNATNWRIEGISETDHPRFEFSRAANG
ncbi:MAG TPA: hypothetical protein VGK29_01725 [Paludibaculum sp.]